MSPSDDGPGSDAGLDYDAITRAAGEIAPWKITAILALDATVGDLERAVAWAYAEEGQTGLHHIETVGKAGSIYEILISDRTDE